MLRDVDKLNWIQLCNSGIKEVELRIDIYNADYLRAILLLNNKKIILINLYIVVL